MLIEDQIRPRPHGSVMAMAVALFRFCFRLRRHRHFFGAEAGLVVSLAVFFDRPVVFRFHRTAPGFRTTLSFSAADAAPACHGGSARSV